MIEQDYLGWCPTCQGYVLTAEWRDLETDAVVCPLCHGLVVDVDEDEEDEEEVHEIPW